MIGGRVQVGALRRWVVAGWRFVAVMLNRMGLSRQGISSFRLAPRPGPSIPRDYRDCLPLTLEILGRLCRLSLLRPRMIKRIDPNCGRL